MNETIKVKTSKVKTELKNILRWEEDGGRIIEADTSTIKRSLVQIVRPSGHDRSWFRRFPTKGGTR
jgi:hypothetical protein